MPDQKPVVSAHGVKSGVDAGKAAGWARVTRMMAFAFGLVGGFALFQDGGFSAAKALAGGLAIGLVTYLLFGAIGAARGLLSITALRDPNNRMRIAMGFGVFVALLGGSAVYLRDGASLTDALIFGTLFGAVAFVAGYFPLLTWILGVLGLLS